MTSVDHLTVVLAERIMGWTAGPDRFSMGKRKWIPRWRFHPTNRMEDALVLLKHLAPDSMKWVAGKTASFGQKFTLAIQQLPRMNPRRPRPLHLRLRVLLALRWDHERDRADRCTF
jgi:hypothetical protein